jgi:hypothetical protein
MTILIGRDGVFICAFVRTLSLENRVHETEWFLVAGVRPAALTATGREIGDMVEDNPPLVTSLAVQMGVHQITGCGERVEEIKADAFVRQRQGHNAIRLD